MPLHLLLLLLLYGASSVSLSPSSASENRKVGIIPGDAKLLSNIELKKSHFHLIPSSKNENDDTQPLPSQPQFSSFSSNDQEIPDNTISPPQDVSKQNDLHQRALLKDYDYAQFGEPCKVYTVEELDAFLSVFGETNDPQEEEVDLSQKRYEQLEQLFNHSRAICDFRYLLTCHKHFLTCACAHPSMGVNRDGICGINIGHPCELSGRTLYKHGILVTPEMSPVKCLIENAECVMESENDAQGAGVSPIRKVCKCRKGFWGATCSRRHANAEAELKVLPPSGDTIKMKDGLSEEFYVSRPIWMTDVGVASGGYFMHPEEIRDQLVKLMEQRGMYSPDMREHEAQQLVMNMEIDVDKEEMVINELHLRQLARLKHGDSCDPERQVILDNPPVEKDTDLSWIEPLPEIIKSWQLGLIQQKKPLCNVYQLLRCNSITKVCECKPGLELDSSGSGLCKIPLGHNCEQDFDPILEFDPIQDRKRFSEMEPPSCTKNTECSDKPFFFQRKCWCSAQNSNCDKEPFDEELYSKVVLSLQSRFILKHGDSCDPKLHQRLLNYQKDENPGYEKRLELFREIIESPESRLCDIESFLNCSDVSRTCECWMQLQAIKSKDGEFECAAMNMASCGRTFKYGKYIYSDVGAQLWQVEKMLKKQFLPDCIPGAACSGGNNPEWAGRCSCLKSSKTGNTCHDQRSILATAFGANLIPPNGEQDLLQVYFDLNAQTVLMEQLMTAGLNDICDSSVGLTLDRIMKFWKEIANSNNTDWQQRDNLPYFIAATKWTKYLVNTAEGNSASLCNATVGLRCHRTTGRCGCHRGARWIDNKCYLDLNENCDPKPNADWATVCMNGSKCLAVQKNLEKSYRCISCHQKKGQVGNCADKFDGDEGENIWDTWDVKDDVHAERKHHQPVISEEQEEAETEESVNEKVLEKRGANTNSDNKIENYFVIKPHTSQDNAKRYISMRSERISKNAKDNSSGYVEVGKLKSGQGGGSSSYKSSSQELNKRQRDTYMQEITRMLKEMLKYRLTPFKKSCHYEDEETLSKVFPTLPNYDLEHIPVTLPMAYSLLSRLYWKGISFCDRNRFLRCTTEHVCGCSFGFGLLEEEGECRLKEHSYCSREFINAGKRSIDFVPDIDSKKKKHPIFQCQRGTKCIQIDLGLPLCIKTNDFGGNEPVDEKVFGRQLFFPNDDFGRSTNETEKPSGSSWTHKRVYSLGIAVAMRLLITWAFAG